jgi:thiosulfate/3-mercaptopyruvate sulfurtransferase
LKSNRRLISLNFCFNILILFYDRAHIGDAICLDTTDFVLDKNDFFPHNLPDKKLFAEGVAKLGISNKHHLILYSRGQPLFISTRIYWTFKYFGHENVSIVDGGFTSWKENNLKTKSGKVTLKQEDEYIINENKSILRSYDDIVNNLETKNELIIDTRNASDYSKDHIPGSISIPYDQIIENNRFKSINSLIKSKLLVDYFTSLNLNFKYKFSFKRKRY